MKNLPYLLLLIWLLMVISIKISAQKNINQIFRSYKNDSGVQCLNFSDNTLKKWLGSDKNMKSYIENAEFIIFSNDTDIRIEDKNRINKLVERDNFALLTEIKDKEFQAQLFIKEDKDNISYAFAPIKNGDTRIYILISGVIDPDELFQLGLNFEKNDRAIFLKKWTEK